MSQTYYTILTKLGAELLANATALGVQLKLTHMAVGDGNGSIPKPMATQTKLINEVRRAAINTVSVDKNNPNQIITEQVIPETEGGWFIHEVGLYDDKGHLIAVGNCPSTYKPKLAEGSGRTQVIRMIIVIDNVDSIALKIDPAVVLATREYVDNLISTKISEHKKSTDHPNATTKSKGFVQLNSATNSKSETEAATPLAVKKVYDLASSALKRGDYGIGSSTGAIINNFDDHLDGGFYQCRTTDFSDLQLSGNSAATLLAYPSSSEAWKVEQVSVVNSKEPRIYYRCDTKEGKQKWYESITTANAIEYTHRFMGDLANKSLNNLTGEDAGNYFQSRNVRATIENGYPVNEAGDLVVMKNGADGAGCSQIYTTYRNARQFIRNYRGGSKSWEPWIEQLTTSNVSADIFGGLPAVKNKTTYDISENTNFKKRPIFNNSKIIALSDFNTSFTKNGYIKLPNGLFVQWGLAQYASARGQEGDIVPFYITFPNLCMSIITSDGYAGVNSTAANPISKSHFKCWCKSPLGAYADTGFFYIAIGF